MVFRTEPHCSRNQKRTTEITESTEGSRHARGRRFFHAYRVNAQDGVVYSGRRMTTRETPLPDFPPNLLEFQRMFPDEAACLR